MYINKNDTITVAVPEFVLVVELNVTLQLMFLYSLLLFFAISIIKNIFLYIEHRKKRVSLPTINSGLAATLLHQLNIRCSRTHSSECSAAPNVSPG